MQPGSFCSICMIKTTLDGPLPDFEDISPVHLQNLHLWKRSYVLYREFQCNRVLSFIISMGFS